MIQKTHYINGEWLAVEKDARREIINPANQEVIALVSEGTIKEADQAIESAKIAFESGIWSGKSSKERGEIVRKVAELIQRDLEELARLETLDTGKTVEESRWDMADIADVFTYYADLADKDSGYLIDSPIPHTTSKVVYEPVGVTSLITPWNYPLLQASWKLAPALVAGNTLVIKPSEITPLTSIKVVELMEEAGLPKGVVNLVLGSGQVVGERMTSHEAVDLVSFTGGLETGKKIMQAASKSMKNIALELGGKNPNIVFEDADLDVAVDQALNAVFFHAGQVCSAGTRLLLEESIHDEFVEKLIKQTEKIKLGDGFSEETEMGPLISLDHLTKVTNYVDQGLKEGAKLEIGGKRAETGDLKHGFYYLPTILTECTTDMRVVQEEGFGPVITVEKFTTEEEAIQLANDSIYGLSGGIWTRDLMKAERVMNALRMGTVWINDYNVYFPQAPWGGYKQSGIGRELGAAGLKEYQEQKHVFTNLAPERLNWFGK